MQNCLKQHGHLNLILTHELYLKNLKIISAYIKSTGHVFRIKNARDVADETRLICMEQFPDTSTTFFPDLEIV
jgi:hypothetical protein